MVTPTAQGNSGPANASEVQNFTPGPILLMGPPGAGKGTQSKILMAQWSIPHILSGELLRDMREDREKSATPLGVQMREVMDGGHLIRTSWCKPLFWTGCVSRTRVGLYSGRVSVDIAESCLAG